MTASVATDTHLRPPWTRVWRAAWLLVSASAILLFILGTSKTLRAPLPSCATPDVNCPPAAFNFEDAQLAIRLGLPVPLLNLALLASTWLAKLGLVVVAAIIFWRRSDDWVAMMLSVSLTSILVEGGFPNMDRYELALAAVNYISLLCFMPLPFLFPNGRYEPRWTRRIAFPLAIAFPIATGFGPRLNWLSSLLLAAWVVLAAYAMIYRYQRVSNMVERQQLKWVTSGLLISLVIACAWIVGVTLYPPSHASPERLGYLAGNALVYVAGNWGLAICMGVAILRYRLWDIDLIVRRTLVYSTFSGLLALAYLGSVLLLQQVFAVVTGRSRSELVTVLSTLIIAALFTPLRRSVQRFIDRRFYRRKFDAVHTLASFGASMRDEVQLDQLAEQLLSVVDETMQPAYVNLWLKKTGKIPS